MGKKRKAKLIITSNRVKCENPMVDRIAKFTALHYLSAAEYDLSEQAEVKLRNVLLDLYREKKYWEAVGLLMNIFKELGNESAQDILVILNADRADKTGKEFMDGVLEYTGIFWDEGMRAAPYGIVS